MGTAAPQSYVTTAAHVPATAVTQTGQAPAGLDLGLRLQAYGTPAPGTGADVGGAAAMAWLTALAVLMFLLWLINKTRLGHALLYYLLALAVVSTLLANYRWLAGVLAPLTTVPAGTFGSAGAGNQRSSGGNTA
jgi:hypothetical protein